MVYINENEINETESVTEYFAKYDNSYLEQYNDLFLLMYVYLHRYKSIEGYVNLTIPSENTLSNKSNCGISTVKKYIQFLCNIKMLYMKNYGSYLRMLKGKEIVVNSNNVYALEEKYLDSDGEEALRSYLKFNMGYIDGFYPFCDNLSNNTVGKKSDSDDWGEADSMDKSKCEDYSLKDILDMSVMSDVIPNPEVSDIPVDEPEKSVQADSIDTAITNPVKTITIKKTQNREIPIDIKIQQYADDLYEQHGYGTGYEKSIFIMELSEKFPGLDDYEKYYDSAKKLHDLSV